MGTYYLRQDRDRDSSVWEDLTIRDLKYMVSKGMLDPSDEIRKKGHSTWHPVTTVKGLGVNDQVVSEKNNK